MTINVDDRLVEEAQRLTGTKELTVLIHEGLRALIARESVSPNGGSPARMSRGPALK